MKNIAPLAGAALAAIAASACCILPALLGVASAGTLGLGATLTPYRPYLMGLTVLLLGVAFYFTYRPAKVACDADGTCATGQTAGVQRAGKAVLWVVTVLTVGAMAYPQIAIHRAQAVASSAPLVVAPATAKTAVFALGKMSCAECSLQIADALKKTAGVHDAKVDFEAKRATVRYDGGRVNVSQLKSVVEKIGYPATEIKQ